MLSSSTSLFAESSNPYYKAEENVYFLMGDFVNEWGFTNFNPIDEKWKKKSLLYNFFYNKCYRKSLCLWQWFFIAKGILKKIKYKK